MGPIQGRNQDSGNNREAVGSLLNTLPMGCSRKADETGTKKEKKARRWDLTPIGSELGGGGAQVGGKRGFPNPVATARLSQSL